MMDAHIKDLFERYERFFNQALAGDTDIAEAAGFYAPEFIAASPAGVRAGKNDAQLTQAMAQGYAHYRAIGTQEMRIRNLRISPLDAQHCIAHVGWRARYARADLPEAAIDFEVHYLVQTLNGTPKIFGWVSGDERAVLREHGIL